MIILFLLVLCAVVCVIGVCVRQCLDITRWLTRPLGPRGHRTPLWLVLSLAATLIGLVVHLQHL